MSKGVGMVAHRKIEDESTDWFTPISIINACGEFDLDPCSSLKRPWDTAKKHYTIETDGLKQKWEGRVWLNPPYGRQIVLWLKKLADHGNGIALIFARTETQWFHDQVWDRADGVLFLKRRIAFHRLDGSLAATNGGAASVLVAYGVCNGIALQNSGLEGHLVRLSH